MANLLSLTRYCYTWVDPTNLKITFSILGKEYQEVLFLMIRWIKGSGFPSLKTCVQETGRVPLCSATVFPASGYLTPSPPARDPVRRKYIEKDISERIRHPFSTRF
jgi:hypothetical protein